MRKVLFTGLLLLVAGITFLLMRERNENRRVRAQHADLLQRLVESEQTRDELVEVRRKQTDQLQRLQGQTAETARLRGEVSRLRQLLKQREMEMEMANRPSGSRTNSSSARNVEPAFSIESFTATARARLAWSQTLVTGGWKTSEGKHCLVLVEPEKVSNSQSTGEPAQIMIRTKYLELSDQLLAQLGFSEMTSEKSDTSKQMILTRDQTTALFDALKDQPETDLLSAPVVTTLDGREAQIKSVDILKTPDGQEREMGPSVNLVPQISPGGESVDLSVVAQLNRRFK